VSRSLLDTNIISNVTKPAPSEALVAWMAAQADEDLFISSLTVAEIRRGILEKPPGKKRRELEIWFSGPEGPQQLFAGRVLPFDEKAGLIWARLMAEGTAKGRPRCQRTIAWLSPKTKETGELTRAVSLDLWGGQSCPQPAFSRLQPPKAAQIQTDPLPLLHAAICP